MDRNPEVVDDLPPIIEVNERPGLPIEPTSVETLKPWPNDYVTNGKMRPVSTSAPTNPRVSKTHVGKAH